MKKIQLSRREWMAMTGCMATTAVVSPTKAVADAPKSLQGVIGLTLGSLQFQLENNVLNAATVPRFMRDDLGMAMIDYNSRWPTSYETPYLTDLRAATSEFGCYYSNLKINHGMGKLDDADLDVRKQNHATARQMIDAAQTLGARWLRFTISQAVMTPGSIECDVLRELAAYGIERGVQLVVENNAWMKSDPESVNKIIAAIGKKLFVPAPDTGNWDDSVRYEGIAKSFSGAVTCDFKVWELNASGEHSRYDIRKCFETAWQSGFRGPWAIEHWHDDLKEFAREVTLLRDQLQKWIDEKKA